EGRRRRRLAGPPGPLVRGPRPGGRTPAAPRARPQGRPLPCGRAGPARAGRPPGRVAPARGGHRPHPGRPRPLGQAGGPPRAARRERRPATADAQWGLAHWCERQGLKAEARSHLAAVTRLAPGRKEAWVRLGYRKDGRLWKTEAQIAAERAEAEAQQRADEYW